MTNLFLAALAAFLAGLFIGGVLALVGMRKLTQTGTLSVTRLLFIAIALSALVWVFTSYAIAVYSTVKLGQVYTMAELSEPAITSIVAVLFAKVLENVFEHNNGGLFGRSNGKDDTYDGAA